MAPIPLANKTILITGGSRGLGAAIARKFAAEGCKIAINYNSNKGDAEALLEELFDGGSGSNRGRGVVVQGDGGSMDDMKRIVDETIAQLGGLDVLVGNAGWTRFSPMSDLHDMTEAEWDRCWAVNVKGQMALLRAALPTFNANEEGGSFIMTSSVAGVSSAGSSMPYSVTKAAGLRLMKNLANSQGPKVRVNAVLPGLLLTEWGMKFGGETIGRIKEMSALKVDTDLEDCANAFVMLAANSSMTGCQIKVDAGLKIDPA